MMWSNDTEEFEESCLYNVLIWITIATFTEHIAHKNCETGF